MLRHLPFIRPDFAVGADPTSTRSGCGPWRSFSSASCRWSASAGSVGSSIGDEFDTTRRAFHQGIAHYDGLYDQSRFFDARHDPVLRSKKQWGCLPVLDPPAALRAAGREDPRRALPGAAAPPDLVPRRHTEGEQVRPCGRCEKCRRVVGMLKALGADPRRCGYTAEQIDDVSCAPSRRPASTRKPPASEQLHDHAHRAGPRCRGTCKLKSRSRPHPEVLKVRIDRERSPMDGDSGRSAPRALPDLSRTRRRARCAAPGRCGSRPTPSMIPSSSARTASSAAEAEERRRWTERGAIHLLGELTWPAGGTAAQGGRRRAAAGRRHRAARSASAPRHRRLRRRLSRAPGRRGLPRPETAGAAADSLRRLVPPRRLPGHHQRQQRDAVAAGLRHRHELRAERHHQAGDRQRPRRQHGRRCSSRRR